MYKNGEIEMVMAQFERNAAGLYGMQYEKEAREIGQPWKNRAYYRHGATNNAFLAFFYGYAVGKAEGLMHATA